MQHSQDPQSATPAGLDSARGRDLALSPATEAKLTAYLDAVCKHMPPAVPSAAVLEMRREMAGHLRASLAAALEIAATEDEATAGVLTQFGTPQIVAGRWKQEWEETLAEMPNAPFRRSLRPAVGVWGLAYAGLFGAGGLLRAFPTMPEAQRVQLTMLTLIGIPLLAGAAVGLLVRRRPVISSAAALLLMLPLYLLVNLPLLNAISPEGWKSSLWFAVNPILIWLPASSATAALAAQMRRLARRRQTAR